ncbi:MAG: TSUP family transporter, partial [Burkholderiales bacterium]
ITTWSGLDLVRGNAIKVVSVFLVTMLALAIFALNDSVHWPLGLALAFGNAVGGVLGVRLAVKKGHRWLKGFVTVTVIAFASRLWLFD